MTPPSPETRPFRVVSITMDRRLLKELDAYCLLKGKTRSREIADAVSAMLQGAHDED